jgi:uncharacterized membrane protein YkgB
MNRVWRRFLFKISKMLGVIAYVIGSMLLGGFVSLWLGYPAELGVMLGSLVFVVLPGAVFLLLDIYKDTKSEIERENRRLMRDLGGNY